MKVVFLRGQTLHMHFVVDLFRGHAHYENIRIIWHTTCHVMKVVFLRGQTLHMNVMVDPLERCISNLSGGRAQYEKMNHEIPVLSDPWQNQKIRFSTLSKIQVSMI
jgi:hypothetical protein